MARAFILHRSSEGGVRGGRGKITNRGVAAPRRAGAQGIGESAEGRTGRINARVVAAVSGAGGRRIIMGGAWARL